MSDKEFVDGLLVKAPNEKAPDFVKCSISIKRKDLGNWLRARDEEWINIDVKVAKSGKWYAEVNNWKPKKSQDSPQQTTTSNVTAVVASSANVTNEFDDDIPF